jgi:anti-sigma-K factor RskA
MATHEYYFELISMYVLGALPDSERRELEAHLAECDICRERLRQERAVVELLPRAVEPIEPSPQTKAKLFARVDADLAGQAARTVVEPMRPTLAPKARPARSRRPLLAFAIVAGVALLAVVGWLVWQGMPSAEEQQIAAIINNPQVRQITLPGTADAPGASGQLYMVPGHSQAVLQVGGLEPLPAGQTYEFWFIRGQEPQPSSLFDVNADGRNTVLVKANDLVENFDAWAVSIEPSGGVASPTGTIVILGGS